MPNSISVPTIKGHSKIVCCKNVDTVNIHIAKKIFPKQNFIFYRKITTIFLCWVKIIISSPVTSVCLLHYGLNNTMLVTMVWNGMWILKMLLSPVTSVCLVNYGLKNTMLVTMVWNSMLIQKMLLM